MKKKFPLLILVTSLLFIVFSLPCHKDLVCTGPAITYLEYPSLWLLILIPLSLLALSLNNQKHKVWLIMTGIFFVTGMFFVYMMPEYDTGIVSVDRELTNWFFIGLYSIVSSVYFFVQYSTKKSSTSPNTKKNRQN